jgi:hypothetical protein
VGIVFGIQGHSSAEKASYLLLLLKKERQIKEVRPWLSMENTEEKN